MDPSIFDSLRQTVAREGFSPYGVHVYQKGRGEAVHFWRSDDPVNLYSAAKTFTSVGVGMALGEGRFGLGDRVLDFFPAWAPAAAPGGEAITIRDLLHMASGKGNYWFAGGRERERTPGDWGEFFFSDPQKEAPGASFFYSNACSYLLGRVIEAVSGQTLRDYLVPRLFTPLGIFNPPWHTCPRGHTLGATQLSLTLGDFAKLGRLLLDGGEWEGRRLVGREYLDAAVSDTIPTASQRPDYAQGYGYHLWRSSVPGAYRADGKYGQFLLVFPDQEAVVTLTAHEELRQTDLLRTVQDDLLARLG